MFFFSSDSVSFFLVRKESVKTMSRQSFTSRAAFYDSNPAQCTMESVQQFDVLAQCEVTACWEKKIFYSETILAFEVTVIK